MGKHKKKHKKEKKGSNKRKSSSSSESSSEEWIEKEAPSDTSSSKVDNIDKNESQSNRSPNSKRDDWMSLPTSFLSASNVDRRREREEKNKAEKERQQYNPRECPRELNPHWKNGGDGLPKFKKPNDDVKYSQNYKSSSSYSNRQSGWRKKKEEPKELRKKDEKQEPRQERRSSRECEGKRVINKKALEERKTEETDESAVLSEKELNALAAKVLKAEIMGNTKLVSELKEKLEAARNARQNAPKVEEVILVHTDSQGRSQPLKQRSEYGEPSGSSKKKIKTETHKDGQRVRYFADDDKYSLKEMFENEKFNTVEDQNRDFIESSSKIKKNDDLDDIFSDNIRKKESDAKIDSRNKDRAIAEHKKVTKSLDNCSHCIQSEVMQKHLMISMGETTYISLPSFEPLADGHCLIIPIRHVSCATQLDENEWADILDIRKALVRMYREKEMDVIFFEVAKNLYNYPHMTIECVPVPIEQGDLAPIYFKKAIDESETEWAMNKKLISLAGRDVRRAVPRGLPYFSVSFGMQEGYAHVIEDEKMFPVNFAQEIIGGMMDLDHSKWRKPRRQKFDEQSKRVMEFSKEWAKFDCTAK